MLLLFLYVSSITPCFGHDVTLTEYTIDTCIYVNRCNSKNFVYHMEGINFDQFSFVHAESDFLQLSEPSYMETTTTEEDPETQERYFLLGKKKNIKSIKHM